jgi:hypothetical protein
MAEAMTGGLISQHSSEDSKSESQPRNPLGSRLLNLTPAASRLRRHRPILVGERDLALVFKAVDPLDNAPSFNGESGVVRHLHLRNEGAEGKDPRGLGENLRPAVFVSEEEIRRDTILGTNTEVGDPEGALEHFGFYLDDHFLPVLELGKGFLG